MGVLDELIARFGEAAVVSVRPYVGDAGETPRWIIEIDGVDFADIDVSVREVPDHPGVWVMLLAYGGEEVELDRWSAERYPYGPAAVVRTLANIRHHLGETAV